MYKNIFFQLVSINNKKKYKLINKYKCIDNIYESLLEGDNEILSDKDLQKISKFKNDNNIKKIIEEINEDKYRYISFENKEFPSIFFDIEYSPVGFFYRGNVDLLSKREVSIGIVGTRDCTQYGAKITRDIIRKLAEYDIVTISGLAKGIDRLVHEESLKVNINTIGVLGCGIKQIYPIENRDIYQEMSKKGLIISEFNPEELPIKYNFPIRNRIISTISECILVPESKIKGGSLITVRYALDYGKNIIAVPGSVYSESSAGCNLLIKEGAYLYTSIQDIIDLLKLKNIGNIKKEVAYIKKESTKNSQISKLLESQDMTLEDIIEMISIDKEEIFGLLFEMQTNGQVYFENGLYKLSL